MLQAAKHYFFLGTEALFGIGVKTYMEAFQADESAVTENDTCGTRTHAGRPHRLSRPTP
jgi:hypothetical protein